MSKIKELYKQNVYGVMGTLLFHILLFSSFFLTEVKLKGEIKEEPVIIDFSTLEETEELLEEQTEKPEEKNTPSADDIKPNQARSNRAVNDAPVKDPFFDESYQREVAEAKKLVSDVNNQLSKEKKEVREYEMPEATTEGMDPDSIKNTIYSGESNIRYFLENRYHIRLPIPVYLAQSGGLVVVEIAVNRKGRVMQAEIRSNSHPQDPMLEVYAKQAALRTVFNEDQSAPALQKGTISYTFVPQ